MKTPPQKLIFMCHPIKKAVGGVKVIYRQAELVNQLLQPLGHSAVVLHPNTWRFKVKWFESSVTVERRWFKWRWMGKPSMSRIDGCFDPQQDMVVLPELWARKYGEQLARMGVPYAIYVQNGYYITKGDADTLNAAYAGARCILTISDDGSRCVAMAFPGTESRILRVHCSVNGQRFNAHQPKENLITYMPRKLADHSSKVLFFLRNHLPAHWRIQAIDGLNEHGVADLLQRSKIFMSFSHFEGLGLPPLEAALCGNQVIGYTGQGAKEYWDPQVFTEIESGDVIQFAQAVLDKIQALDNLAEFPVLTENIRALSAPYSPAQELADMQRFVTAMGLPSQPQ
ncbi:glycosyltransferase [Limnohabitans sp. Rim8]|uniref:glycosyltransferase n=1 Tax=Limnohabitans sp. Rim8 TaxID=1100718 RepID=UPI0025D5D909|nr:glycosyltransferase [Limnohabitans sp. Rim8]